MTWAALTVGRRSRRQTHQGIHLAPRREPSVSILVVEDDENLRSLLQRVLEGVGFTVLSASDGAEALDLCQQHIGTNRSGGE